MLYQRKITAADVLATKLEFQLQHSRYALVGIQSVGVATVTVLLWFQLLPLTLFTWVVGMLLLVLAYSVRLGSALLDGRYHRHSNAVYREMMVGAAILGLSWTASVVWFDQLLVDQYFFIVVLIVTICCVATIAVSSVIRGIYLAQIFSALIPVATWLGWHYDERPFNLVLAMLLIGLSLLMALVSGWMSHSIRQMVESSLEREAMARDLADLTGSLSVRNVQLQEARKQLSDMATVDELTGLRNRRGANQVFETEISRAKRAGMALSIIMLDVDHFKRYNDTYGHPAGDIVLQKVAEVLLSVTSRAGELAVRMGGEEFMLILPGSTQSDAMGTAAAIQQRMIDAAITHEGSPGTKLLTLSQGVVSCIPRLETEVSDLIEAADRALYKSKENGRHQATLSSFSP